MSPKYPNEINPKTLKELGECNLSFLARWADAIERVVRPVSRGCMFVAMAWLIPMALLLVADVIARYVFRNPIPGTEELEEFMLVVVGFLGLAYTGVLKSHVRVDLIVKKFPLWVQHVIDTCTGITSLMLFVLIAWQTAVWTLMITDQGLVSPVLVWPKFPFAAIAAFGCLLFWFILIIEILRSVHGAIAEGGKKALWIIPGLALTGAIIFIALNIELPISGLLVGLAGIGLLVVLLFLRMPIGFAMGFTGLIGAWYFMGWNAGLGVLQTTPYYTASKYILCVVPLFLLMGQVCFRSGISKDLYDSAYAWLGHYPGGMASATIGGCAGFAAICGDSLATAAAMGTVALPEMRRYNYDDSLSTGCIAAGGTLGILIPPSMGFVWYGILTEESIGKLFIAGIIPGIMLAGLFITVITIRSKLNPKLGPPGPPTAWVEKFKALRGTWGMLTLFLLVVGGIYMGIFTVIEAGGIGAVGALVLMAVKGKFNLSNVYNCLMETGRTIAFIIAILMGVWILGYYMAASMVPLRIADFTLQLEVSRYVILVIFLSIYLILGCLMNIIPMIILTLPLFWPTIVATGFDPIWFGVIMVVMMEMGQITPPIGMNVFIIAGVAKTVPLGTIFKGIFPFLGCEVVFVIVLTLFPQIALWLPSMM